MNPSPFLMACRGERPACTPVWIMRQAGRYLPEYRRLRASVSGFLELCKTPKLAAQVTLMPIEAIGVDAAILFSDILIPVEAMGVPLRFDEGRGPVLGEVNMARDLSIPGDDAYSFVWETIALSKEHLKPMGIPLIGFSGAPFTLASYIIEGGSTSRFVKTKEFIYTRPREFAALMELLTEAIVRYLDLQARAGVDAIQLFDSWMGTLSPYDYQELVLPYTQRIARAVREMGVPFIHFGTGGTMLLKAIKDEIKPDVVGIDWRITMAQAVEMLGSDTVVQGNLEPCALFLPENRLSALVARILEEASAFKAHIFNLGHGIMPMMEPEKARFLVDEVHRLGRRPGQ